MTDSPEKKNLSERAADLSDAMFESSEARRRDAMQAVRAFVDTVDEAIPNVVDPSMRKKIIDSALELADKLGATQLLVKMCGWNHAEKHEHGASNKLTELLKKLRGWSPG